MEDTVLGHLLSEREQVQEARDAAEAAGDVAGVDRWEHVLLAIDNAIRFRRASARRWGLKA